MLQVCFTLDDYVQGNLYSLFFKALTMAKKVVTKNWYKSSTVWGGFLLALAGLVTAVAQLLLGEISQEMMLMSIGAFLKGCWDVYNRFKTTEPIA